MSMAASFSRDAAATSGVTVEGGGSSRPVEDHTPPPLAGEHLP